MLARPAHDEPCHDPGATPQVNERILQAPPFAVQRLQAICRLVLVAELQQPALHHDLAAQPRQRRRQAIVARHPKLDCGSLLL
jgi:hypothetical protein